MLTTPNTIHIKPKNNWSHLALWKDSFRGASPELTVSPATSGRLDLGEATWRCRPDVHVSGAINSTFRALATLNGREAARLSTGRGSDTSCDAGGRMSNGNKTTPAFWTTMLVPVGSSRSTARVHRLLFPSAQFVHLVPNGVT